MTLRCVALLRGVNVGRANRIAMADLRRVVEELGYSDPRTLLNSGNVVFGCTAGDLGDVAARIRTALTEQLGVSSRVTVLSAAQVADAIEANPLPLGYPSRLLVAFLGDAAAAAAVAPLVPRDWAPETLALRGRVAYLDCAGGAAASPLWTAVGKAAGDAVTARNWTTVLKIRELMAG